MSVDILSYFKQLLPVYENDESVYCISAWNDQVRKQKTHKGGGGSFVRTVELMSVFERLRTYPPLA